MTYRVARHSSAVAFLERAAPWLLQAEDRHNLVLGIAYACAADPDAVDDAYFATVERGGEVLGCCTRTPPHQVLLTDMPAEAVGIVVQDVSGAYPSVPAVHGPAPLARAFAETWVEAHGGRAEPGTDQRLYRLDVVIASPPAPGQLRLAEPCDARMALAWSEAFCRETHVPFDSSGERTVSDWIERGALWIWEDGEPACMAVARGRTARGIRIGFVYTLPPRRRRGYAGACVAELSRRMLASGLEFCVLFADLTNPTTNALYQRIGYRHVTDVRDYHIHPEAPT